MLQTQEKVIRAHQDVRRACRLSVPARLLALLVCGFVLLIGCTTDSTAIPTVEMQTEPFGKSTKAEFYPLQYDSARSDGVNVPRAGSAEVMYVVPTPLIAVADIAQVDITSAADPSLSRVSMTLSAGARARVQSFVAASSAAHMVLLVWRDEIHFNYTAQSFDSAAPIIVADRLPPGYARALADALK